MTSTKRAGTIRHVALTTGVMLGLWSFVSGLLQGLLGYVEPTEFNAGDALGPVVPLFVVCLLNVLIATWLIHRTSWTGLRLGLAVFTVIFGVMFFMTQIETIYFNDAVKMPAGIIVSTVVAGLFVGLVASWLSVRQKKKIAPAPDEAAPAPRSMFGFEGFIWKTGLLAVAYVVFYFFFGYFIAWQFPTLREYYSGSTELLSFFTHMENQLKTDAGLALFQLFRGVLWAGMGLFVASALDRAASWERYVIVGLSLSVGLSTLLFVPNPYMPSEVRFGHFFELLLENFAFGALVVWTFRKSLEE